MNTPFRIPTRVEIEDGCRRRIPQIVKDLHGKRVLLVTDPGIMSAGIVSPITSLLEDAGLTVETFDEVEANPRVATARNIADRAQAGDVLVGLGGGSVLDAAKAAAMLASNEGDIADYVGANKFTNDPLPFIAVPTTCGTGSEVTWVAVITDDSRSTKISIKGDKMFPDAALVDSELIRELPPELIATTGMDALTHAIEATTGKPRNPVSDAMAEKAIELLLLMLPRAVRGAREDDPARQAVMRASTIAGLAFGNTDVGGVHCLSETLGGLIDVAHGLANAILLAPVMRYHLPVAHERLEALSVFAPGATGSAEGFLQHIEDLGSTLGIPKFSSLNVDPQAWPEIAKRSTENGSNGSNPQPMAEEDYLDILRGLS